MSVDSTVDARMHAFMKDVQELMEKHEMGIAVIGLSTPMAEDGFTTFAATLRDSSRPVDEQLAQLDAIRNDILAVYDDVGRSIAKKMMGSGELRERLDKVLDGLKTLQTAAGEPVVVDGLADSETVAQELPQSVVDMIDGLRREGKNVAVVRLAQGEGKADDLSLFRSSGAGKKGKTFLN